MKRLKIGSLFTGIGGIEVGLEATKGFETLWQVEIDTYASRILEKRWPHVKRYKDVKTVGVYNLEPVDLICGGFPCQDISRAGSRKGLKGERSGLWYEFYRIICELRPQYVLVENVSTLRRQGLDEVLRNLAKSGYDAEWDCLPAAAFGAPHFRERIFIVAYTRCQRRGQTGSLVYPERGNLGKDGQLISQVTWNRLRFDRKSYPPFGKILSEPLIRRMDDGISCWVDRLKCLGNAVVPQITYWIGKRIWEYEKLQGRSE